MQARAVFPLERAQAAVWLVLAGLAGVAPGLGCSSSGGSQPAPSTASEGGGSGGKGPLDAAGSSSSGGQIPAMDAPAGEDASDSGPSCSGDGGPGTFTCTGSLSVGRDAPLAAALPDGTVLVAGGWNGATGVLISAEIYDPVAGTFGPTGDMAGGHLWGGWGAALPALANGKVLVAGGLDVTGAVSSAAELYDPVARAFSNTGPMLFGAISMSPVVLDDGSVLFIGGWTSVTPQTAAELPGWSYAGGGTAEVQRYYPALGAFRKTGSLAEARLFGCNVRGSTGNVLAISGAQGPADVERNVEQYDVNVGLWSVVANFAGAQFCAGGFALPSGQMLLTGTGGLTSATLPVPGVLLFNPVTNAIGPTTNALSSFSPAFVQLANGDVLAFGGTLNGAPTATAQVYGARTNSWRTVGSLNQPRGGAIGALLLSSGDVLVVGGADQNGIALATAEIYHP